jgi:hypothetical protein
VSKAKQQCGYTQAPILPVCMNCAAFRSEMTVPAWMRRELESTGVISLNYGEEKFSSENEVPDKHRVESKMRCADHGFAVKKMASCNSFRPKAGVA